jgi:nucleoside-diphosphate-sugar epimerase
MTEPNVILITGGAGFIGSNHANIFLQKEIK